MFNKDAFERPAPHPAQAPVYKCPLSINNLKDIFSQCSDFEDREISFGLKPEIILHVCWIDGIVSGADVSTNILRPLTELYRAENVYDEPGALLKIIRGGVYSYSVKLRDNTDDVVSDLCHGHCAVLFSSGSAALCFEVRSDNVRDVSEPTLEKSLKGAKDSFVETLRINTALVRRRIASPALKLVEKSVGRKSNTSVAVMYVDGIAAPDTVEELESRLENVDIDGLLATGMLEEYIVDSPLSPFPQLVHTERPDRFAMYLLEGHVGLLIDGLPIALILPVTFAEFMQVSSDTGMHFTVASSLSLLRYLALIISLFLPAFYVAVAMYHQELIPVKLLLSIIEAKQDVPFSTAIEVLSMLIAFGLLQEAGLRLPNPIGDTVSIIGALIVGQSAVEARVVSPIAIIVVAVSGIACYTLPSQDVGAAVRLLRFFLLAAAIVSGMFGVAVVTCLIVLHLCSLDSFGVNYTSPVSDGRPFGLFRLLIRRPKPSIKFRDPQLRTPDKRRQR